MTPCPALIIVPAYDYILVWVRAPWSHRHKVTALAPYTSTGVTKTRVAFPRKVL